MSQRRAPRGRPPASPGGGASNAGVRGALLLGVAVILGIVLLQQFDTDISTGTVGQVSVTSIPSRETTTTRRIGLTTVPAVTTTTGKARPKAEVKVLVANGAGVRGLGAATTTALKSLGYATLDPTDATGAIDRSAVQFADGYEVEAREIAASLGLPATAVTRLASPPVAAAALDDAKVLVVLGVFETTSTTAGGVGATTSTTRRAGT